MAAWKHVWLCSGRSQKAQNELQPECRLVQDFFNACVHNPKRALGAGTPELRALVRGRNFRQRGRVIRVRSGPHTRGHGQLAHRVADARGGDFEGDLTLRDHVGFWHQASFAEGYITARGSVNQQSAAEPLCIRLKAMHWSLTQFTPATNNVAPAACHRCETESGAAPPR